MKITSNSTMSFGAYEGSPIAAIPCGYLIILQRSLKRKIKNGIKLTKDEKDFLEYVSANEKNIYSAVSQFMLAPGLLEERYAKNQNIIL